MDRVAALRSKKLRRGAFYMRPSVVSRFAGGYAIRSCVLFWPLGQNSTFFIIYYLLFLIFYLYNSSFSLTSLTCFITLAFVGPP